MKFTTIYIPSPAQLGNNFSTFYIFGHDFTTFRYILPMLTPLIRKDIGETSTLEPATPFPQGTLGRIIRGLP